MKKITCMLLAIILTVSVFSIPVFAATGTTSKNVIGYMPKMETDSVITLDGVYDEAYKDGRYIDILNRIVSTDNGLSATANITWDGEYIYAFVEVNDFFYTYDTSVTSGKSITQLADEAQPWLSDCVELSLYKGTEPPAASAVEQYRIDSDGNLTYYTNYGDSPTQYYGTELSQFEGAAVINEDDEYQMHYSVEYKIPYSLAEGDCVYFQVVVNSLSDSKDSTVIIGNKNAAGIWDTGNFDALVCCAPFTELSEITDFNAEIAAIGTFNSKNYTEKQSLIEAATQKAEMFYDKYGSNVENFYDSQTLYMAQSLFDFYSMYANIVFGDLNDDNTVSAADALLVLQASVMKIELDDMQSLAGDVNCDYDVSAVDALLVLQYSVHKVAAFPAEAYVPYVEFFMPLEMGISATEGCDMEYYAEVSENPEAKTLYKICTNENGTVVIEKPEGDDTSEIRTIITDAGLFRLNINKKTYTMTAINDVDESIIYEILGGFNLNQIYPSNFGYYNGLPSIISVYTADSLEIPGINYDGVITVAQNFVVEKDGSIKFYSSLKDENGNLLLTKEFKDFTFNSGFDSSVFDIPSDFTLVETL